MTSNDALIKTLKGSYNTNNFKEVLDKIEKAKQEEFSEVDQRYHGMLAEKDLQHKEFLEEIDQLMLEQENEISELKEKNDQLTQQLERLQSGEMQFFVHGDSKNALYDGKENMVRFYQIS
jgi:vacuolar-type H+-ATPase subunit I/STV1